MALKMETKLGGITIAEDIIANIVGKITTNCYGVVGMASNKKNNGLTALLRNDSMSKGIQVTINNDGALDVALHIIVLYGINIDAVCKSIINNVRYQTKNFLGVSVHEISVHVDGIRI